jgi:hypothetical protein
MKKSWVLDPHSGGVKIPEAVKTATRDRILKYAEQHYAGKYIRIDVRFRNQLCYIDAYKEPSYMPPEAEYDAKQWGESREARLERLRNLPIHLCRLRYFGGEGQWSMAFFTYSNEKYSPCYFRNGTFFGTPEEAFEASALYLTD